jgi:hypothetical protein
MAQPMFLMLSANLVVRHPEKRIDKEPACLKGHGGTCLDPERSRRAREPRRMPPPDLAA